jgi:hypothetical protein
VLQRLDSHRDAEKADVVLRPSREFFCLKCAPLALPASGPCLAAKLDIESQFPISALPET